MNYFTIERNKKYLDHAVLVDENGSPIFQDFLDMSYDEMKHSDTLDDFVATVMVAADNSAEERGQTIITLIGSDDIFIWSIIMGEGENDEIKYSLVDWKKDGKSYRYAP